MSFSFAMPMNATSCACGERRVTNLDERVQILRCRPHMYRAFLWKMDRAIVTKEKQKRTNRVRDFTVKSDGFFYT